MDVLGYAASCAVLATFLMRTMTPLRLIAILSNILFLSYGYLQEIYPVFFLHVVLLPINAWRLFALQLGPRVSPFAAAAIRSPKPFTFWFAVGVAAGLVGPAVLVAAAEPAAARALAGHVIVDMQDTASWLAKRASMGGGRGSLRPGRAVNAAEGLVNVRLAPEASFDVGDSEPQYAI